MSRVIDSAKAHFKELLNAGLRGPIQVPEWETEIYFKPATTFNQESKIIELTAQGKQVEALVTALIMRSLDADGKPIFTKADQPELMRFVDPNIIMRVMSEMNDPEAKEAADEALKN
jgi:hypothetical protein